MPDETILERWEKDEGFGTPAPPEIEPEAKALVRVPGYTRADGTRVGGYSYNRDEGHHGSEVSESDRPGRIDEVDFGDSKGYRAYAKDGTHLGSFDLGPRRDVNGRSVREIQQVMAMPGHRRQGVATALLDEARRKNPGERFQHSVLTPGGEAWRRSLPDAWQAEIPSWNEDSRTTDEALGKKALVRVPGYTRADGTHVAGYSYHRDDGDSADARDDIFHPAATDAGTSDHIAAWSPEGAGLLTATTSHGVTYIPPGMDSKIGYEDLKRISDTVNEAVRRYPGLTKPRHYAGKTERPLTQVIPSTAPENPIAISIRDQLEPGGGHHALEASASAEGWSNSVLLVNDIFNDPFNDPKYGPQIHEQLSPATVSYEGTTWHEIGHLLEYASGDAMPEQPREAESERTRQLLAKYGITEDEITGLSKYAGTDFVEGLGELSAMYHLRPDLLTPELRAKAERLFNHLGGVE